MSSAKLKPIGMTDRQYSLRESVFNSNDIQLEEDLKACILESAYVKKLVGHLVARHFPEKRHPDLKVVGPSDGNAFLSHPDPQRALDLDQHVLGVGANGERLLQLAMLHRDVSSVMKLLDFYPAIPIVKGSPIVCSICPTNVAHTKGLFNLAVAWGNARVFSALLKARQGFILTVDNQQCTWIRSVSVERDGLNDLLFNICNNPVEMSQMVHDLVTAKADVTTPEGREDLPIHAAAIRGHTNIIKILLASGANVDAQNHMLQTPLHFAFRYGQKAVADILLENGANLRATDNRGRTPLHYVYKELGQIQAHIDYLAASYPDLEERDKAAYVGRSGRVDESEQEAESANNEALENVVIAIGKDTQLISTESQPTVSSPRAPHFGGPALGAEETKGEDSKAPLALPNEDMYVPEELAEVAGRYEKDPHVRNWLLPKLKLDSGSNLSIEERHKLAIQVRRKVLHEKRSLDLVVDMAVRMGADLTARDNMGNLCFTHKAMLQWYKDQQEALETEAWTNVATGYTSQLFEDPRTMLAVQRKWELDIQGKVYLRLLRWSLFIILVMIIGIWEAGRDAHFTRAFQSGFEETILNDEYGDHHSGFLDMRNEGELWQWLNEVVAPNVYDNSGQYRDGHLTAQPQRYSKGSIYFFNKLIGRPRMRQLRSLPLACDSVSGTLKGFANSTCFSEYDTDEADTRPFKTGSLDWTWAEIDSPSFEGIVSTYDGSGFTYLFPATEAEWTSDAGEMMNNAFVDMNTRAIIVEMALFNPGHNMFLVARMLVEFTAAGLVLPSYNLDTLRLLKYNNTEDDTRFIFEVIAFAVMIWYIIREIMQMSQPWPKVKDRTPGATGFLETPTYKLTCRMFQCKKKKRGAEAKPAPAAAAATDDGSQRSVNGRRKARGSHVVLMHEASNAGRQVANLGASGVKALGNTICNMSACGYQLRFAKAEIDTRIRYRPYFFNSFNLLDLAMMATFITVIVLHVHTTLEANKINWEQLDGFVNVYNLSLLVRVKQYMLALTVFVVWIKTLEHLRVNSSLSTFILIIKGMMSRLASFFTVLIVCLLAFAGLQYVAFGLQSDDASTLALATMSGFAGALGDVDFTSNMESNRYLAPMFSLAFAVFVLILLFNLLIAVMSEAYEEIKDRANAAWCFTQFQMIDEDFKAKEERRRMQEALTEGARPDGWCKCCKRKKKGRVAATAPAPPAPSS